MLCRWLCLCLLIIVACLICFLSLLWIHCVSSRPDVHGNILHIIHELHYYSQMGLRKDNICKVELQEDFWIICILLLLSVFITEFYLVIISYWQGALIVLLVSWSTIHCVTWYLWQEIFLHQGGVRVGGVWCVWWRWLLSWE